MIGLICCLAWMSLFWCGLGVVLNFIQMCIGIIKQDTIDPIKKELAERVTISGAVNVFTYIVKLGICTTILFYIYH